MGLAEKPSDDMLKKLVKRIPTDVVKCILKPEGFLGHFKTKLKESLQNGLCCVLGLLEQ